MGTHTFLWCRVQILAFSDLTPTLSQTTTYEEDMEIKESQLAAAAAAAREAAKDVALEGLSAEDQACTKCASQVELSTWDVARDLFPTSNSVKDPPIGSEPPKACGSGGTLSTLVVAAARMQVRRISHDARQCGPMPCESHPTGGGPRGGCHAAVRHVQLRDAHAMPEAAPGGAAGRLLVLRRLRLHHALRGTVLDCMSVLCIKRRHLDSFCWTIAHGCKNSGAVTAPCCGHFSCLAPTMRMASGCWVIAYLIGFAVSRKVCNWIVRLQGSGFAEILSAAHPQVCCLPKVKEHAGMTRLNRCSTPGCEARCHPFCLSKVVPPPAYACFGHLE